ncbi:MAG: hypothetical protein LZ172_06645 [Thaumarchaeota archaeon]|nr:hypothetical protein [Candidatus Geocrenenecus arthurdayi]MCL7396954.1 hypothetical protein [Candidatus Geocrenenecus arthurdayi]MCL7404005.1 hypothetical protein [Candidatus Geocrenenecus arthurdayi]
MRLKKTFYSMLVLAVLLFSYSYYVVEGDEQALERLIEVDRYGFLYVIDNIPLDGGYAEVGFPKQLISNLVDYYTPNGSIELKIEGQIFWLKVSPRQSSSSVKLITIFGDLVKRSGAENFKIEFPVNPLTREDLEKVNVRIILPEGSNISRISPSTIEVKENNIEAEGALSIDTTQVHNLQLEFAIGEISLLKPIYTYLTLDLSTRQAEYNVKFTLRDGKTIDSFYFNLPNGSRILETRDHLKKLPNSYDERTGKLTVSLDRKLKVGESQTIIIRFEPPENFFYKVEEGSILISPYLPFNLSTPDYRVSVILPSMEYVSSSLDPIEVKKTYPEKTLLTFSLGVASPLTMDLRKFNVIVKPVLSMFSFIPYMLGVSMIIMIFGVLAYSLKPVFKPSLKEYEERARKLIDEVEGLMSSCRVLGELITSKKILDKGYVRPRILGIRNDVARHVSKIASYSVDLKKTYPEAVDRIDSLMVTSRMIQESIEHLWTQTHRYLTGAIAKTLFTKQVEENYKSILKYLDKLVKEEEMLRKASSR